MSLSSKEAAGFWQNTSSVTYRSAMILTVAFLTGLGLLAIYASSSIPASEKFGTEFFYFKKQAWVALFGFTLIFIMGHIPFVWIERLTLPFLLLTIVLLGLVQFPAWQGRAHGAARWLMVGGVSLQPAEFAKLAMILFLAKNLSRPSVNLHSFKDGLLLNLIVYGVIAVLLMLQPDFGTTALLGAILMVMLFVAGLPQRYLVYTSLAGIAGFVLAVIFAPYRLQRLLSFLDPWSQFRGSGFQIIQSYLGFQNGAFWGAGLGESRQKLFFLPEAHTDFILAVVAEELGVLGVILICSLFSYLVYLGYKVTFLQTVAYRRFLALGLTSLIALQAILNMGVTMGLLPTKGMTLPFVSHGANSLLVFLMAVAILARISQEAPGRTRKALGLQRHT